MSYEVLMSDPALDELEAAYHWLALKTTVHAPLWFNGAVEAINSLAENPGRCPLAPESPRSPEPIRQLLYGDKRHAFRILFTIRGDKVIILHIRHAARRPLP